MTASLRTNPYRNQSGLGTIDPATSRRVVNPWCKMPCDVNAGGSNQASLFHLQHNRITDGCVLGDSSVIVLDDGLEGYGARMVEAANAE